MKAEAGDDGAGSDGETGGVAAGGLADGSVSATKGVGGGPVHEQAIATERVSNQKLKRITFIPTHPTAEHQGFQQQLLYQKILSHGVRANLEA